MKQAAGLLVFRKSIKGYEVLLTHPGGPFWAKKDVWSIPKGEAEPGEELTDALVREFIEETGLQPPLEGMIELGEAKASGKVNHIWAVEADLDISKFKCVSMATMQWPPKSGEEITFPENDKAAWIPLDKAAKKVYKSQTVFIGRLAGHLGVPQADTVQPPNSTLF